MDGDPLYTLGHFETDSGGLRTFTPKQLIGNVLSEWKQDFSKLLARFDKNSDGELDPKRMENCTRCSLERSQTRTNRTIPTTSRACAYPTTTSGTSVYYWRPRTATT